MILRGEREFATPTYNSHLNIIEASKRLHRQNKHEKNNNSNIGSGRAFPLIIARGKKRYIVIPFSFSLSIFFSAAFQCFDISRIFFQKEILLFFFFALKVRRKNKNNVVSNRKCSSAEHFLCDTW